MHRASFDQFSDVATVTAADYVRQEVNGPRTGEAGNFVVSDIGSVTLATAGDDASLVDLAFAESGTIIDPINGGSRSPSPT